MTEIIYPELSYQIMGVLFKVHNKLGNNRKEKHYQRAIEIEFTKGKIDFKREVCVPIKYENNSIGRYYVDFVVNEKLY